MSININNTIKNDTLNKVIIFSSVITSLISIYYAFTFFTFNNYNILGEYGDNFLTSIYRIYGTFMYPNSLGLFNLIGIILSIKYIKNNIYKITLYINLLCLILTMSKSMFIFFIIVLVVLFITNKKSIKIFLPMFIPILYNINIYRTCVLNDTPLYFMIITIICILITFILNIIYNKNKKYFFTIFIFILSTSIIFIDKPLIVKQNNQNLIIVDMMNTKSNRNKINIEIEGNNFSGNIYLYRHFIQNSSLSYVVKKTLPIQKKVTIEFDKDNKDEFYSLKIGNLGSDIKITSMTLNNERVNLDYNLIPYNFIKSFEQTQYDVSSVSGRFDIYKYSISLMKEKPLLGHGFNYFRTTEREGKLKDVLVEHSQIMTLGVENGIISIIMWLILLIVIVINCIRNYTKNNIYEILIIMLLIYSSLIDFSLQYNFYLLILFIYSMKMLNNKNTDVLYICSDGGHLTTMNKIIKNIDIKNYVLITENNRLKANCVLKGSRQNLFKYIFVLPINLFLNIIYFIHYNPKIIITTGAHTGVFMCYLGKIFRKKVLFIEVFDRYETISLSGKFVYKFVDKFIVQHTQLLKKYKKAIYIGEMY